MLGVRIDSELEQRLAAVARSQGRSKSDIAREAVRRYVERHDEAFLAEAKRQSLRGIGAGMDGSGRSDGSAWAPVGMSRRRLQDFACCRMKRGDGSVVVADARAGRLLPASRDLFIVVQSPISSSKTHDSVTLCLPLLARSVGNCLFRVPLPVDRPIPAFCDVESEVQCRQDPHHPASSRIGRTIGSGVAPAVVMFNRSIRLCDAGSLM